MLSRERVCVREKQGVGWGWCLTSSIKRSLSATLETISSWGDIYIKAPPCVCVHECASEQPASKNQLSLFLIHFWDRLPFLNQCLILTWYSQPCAGADRETIRSEGIRGSVKRLFFSIFPRRGRRSSHPKVTLHWLDVLTQSAGVQISPRYLPCCGFQLEDYRFCLLFFCGWLIPLLDFNIRKQVF